MRTLEVFAGHEITKAITIAIAEAGFRREECCFEFNGVTVVVAADSRLDLIYRDWHRGLCGYLGAKPTVGPHPRPELTPEELASDATIEAERKRRSDIAQAEYDKKAANKRSRLQELLKDAPPMELSDTDGWKKCVENNQDPYGARVVKYAEDWARLMQREMANGSALQSCAKELSHVADDDGITGNMYGCAVNILAHCWRHGEEIRRWREG